MTTTDPIYVVYDGECPFCSNYVKMLRIRESLGNVQLLDARQGGAVVARLQQAGIDLDEGMALVDGDRILHGDACLHALASMSTSSDLFNRLNAAIFRNRTATRLLYPVLRSGRNATLRLLGRKKLRQLPANDRSI